MADQYVVFYLTPGMQPPNDGLATGIALSDGGIVWKGTDADIFPTVDPKAGENYAAKGSHTASTEEISEYEQVLVNMQNPIEE